MQLAKHVWRLRTIFLSYVSRSSVAQARTFILLARRGYIFAFSSRRGSPFIPAHPWRVPASRLAVWTTTFSSGRELSLGSNGGHRDHGVIVVLYFTYSRTYIYR